MRFEDVRATSRVDDVSRDCRKADPGKAPTSHGMSTVAADVTACVAGTGATTGPDNCTEDGTSAATTRTPTEGTALGCSMDGCDRKHSARGLCKMHWTRWRRHGDPTVVNTGGNQTTSDRTCDVDGCGRGHHARGLCLNHYQAERSRRRGRAEQAGVFDRTMCEDCNGVPLGGGRWCLDCFNRHTAKPLRNPTRVDGDPARTAVKTVRVPKPQMGRAA